MHTTTPLSNILIVGAGKVAFHLACALQKFIPNCTIHVFSRQSPGDITLWPQSIQWYHQWDTIPEVDLVMMAVSDNAIGEVIAIGGVCPQLKSALWVHTSGATPMSLLNNFVSRFGLFYPLQSFSKNASVDWKDIPVGIDAGTLSDLEILKDLAKHLGASTFRLVEEQRQCLHLAAVFANNFTNHCLGVAAEILKEKGLDFNLLKPLIQLTFQKALTQHPFDVQTGPAIRGDVNTIAQHEQLLQKNFQNYLEMYQVITEQIQITHSLTH